MKAKILELLRREDGYVSGQELCTILNVSRTAVWKAVKSLENEGYVIEAVRNKGYRLVENESENFSKDIYSKSEIASRLRAESGVKEVVFYDSIDSTNSECARRATEGVESGLLIVSDNQTNGKGRRGRSWTSPPGSNVYFSLMSRPDIRPEDAPMITLLMSLAVCMGMEKISEGRIYKTSGRTRAEKRDANAPMIKWPNDIVIKGKKCCGMLTEMSCEADYISYVVIGVGINVRHQNFPEEIAGTAISLEDAWEKKVPRSLLVAEIINEFGPLLKRFEEEKDLGFVRREYFDRLINAGRKVRVLDPKGEYDGIARGINETGELLVETSDGKVHEVNSGEVSVRGIYGYAL